MKCRCGSPDTHTRRAPWDLRTGEEKLCDRCADRVTAHLNRRQALLERDRPQRIREGS
jgi:hypothetical protein